VTQPTLFELPKPRADDLLARGIDYRCCSCADDTFLRDAAGAELVIADPPWLYDQQSIGESQASDHYDCLEMDQIVDHLNALSCARMALWITWPMMSKWPTATAVGSDFAWRWGEHRSGGAWTKSDADNGGHYGQGYHWAGCSEPVLGYTTDGSYTDRTVALRNAHVEPAGLHSRKPVQWMVGWVKRWCPPGGLVVDPYAGLASVAEAVLLAGGGRRYLGTEISDKRHAQGMALLAQVRCP
jgi:hypothetical protein